MVYMLGWDGVFLPISFLTQVGPCITLKAVAYQNDINQFWDCSILNRNIMSLLCHRSVMTSESSTWHFN